MMQWGRIQEKPQFEPFDPAVEFLTPSVAAKLRNARSWIQRCWRMVR